MRIGNGQKNYPDGSQSFIPGMIHVSEIDSLLDHPGFFSPGCQSLLMCQALKKKGRHKMVISPNVPRNVINWFICREKIRDAIKSLADLNAGQPRCFCEALKLKQENRRRLTPEETLSSRCRVLRIIRHYNFLKDRLSLTLNCDPESYLFDQDDMLSLIGSTLKFKERSPLSGKNTWRFMTAVRISEDGKRISDGDFLDDFTDGFSNVDLIMLGFGRSGI